MATNATGLAAVVGIGAAVLATDALNKTKVRLGQSAQELQEKTAALHAKDAALNSTQAVLNGERQKVASLGAAVNQLVKERDDAWHQISVLTGERDSARRDLAAKDGELKKAAARIAELEAAAGTKQAKA